MFWLTDKECLHTEPSIPADAENLPFSPPTCDTDKSNHQVNDDAPFTDVCENRSLSNRPLTDKSTHQVNDDPPLSDVMFVTSKIPLSENQSTSNNVNILNYERVHGDMHAFLRDLKENTFAKSYTQATELTPGKTRIVAKASNFYATEPKDKENKVLSEHEEIHGDMHTFHRTLKENTFAKSNTQRQPADFTPGKTRIVAQASNRYATEPNDKENKVLSDTVSCTESMLENSNNELVMSRDSLEPVVPSGSLEGASGKRHRQSSICNDESGFTTPPGRNEAIDDKMFILQSKSRLKSKPQRIDSDEQELEVNSVQPPTNARTPSPTGSRHSPSSSTFSSPGFSSSLKSELTSQQNHTQHHYQQPNNDTQHSRPHEETSPRSVGAYSRPLSRFNSQSQLGSTSDLHSSRNDFCSLKTSESELFWGSTKLRNTVNKWFTIKNMSNRRLSTNIEVVGPGFQIVGSNKPIFLTLQGQECRTITISFCPTMIGTAIGKVVFFGHADNNSSTQKCVLLYGFGGTTKINVLGPVCAPHGRPFIVLGELSDILQTNSATKSFNIVNQGLLPGVAIISVKAIIREGKVHDASSVRVYPNKFILAPESQQQVCVEFQPRRTELRKLERKHTNVSSVATLEIMYGDEPNRQRIVRLVKQNPNMFEPLENLLCDDFPDHQMDINFDDFNESTVC